MKDIAIQTDQYEIIDTVYGLTIPDSFVHPKNKIGGGNGEAKLYVGNENPGLVNFFGGRGFNINCFLLKEDLIEFLDETRTEYLNPTQDYRNIISLPDIWEEKRAALLQYPEKIKFKVQDQHTLQGPRMYINSEDKAYQLLRKIPLPVISHLNIYKLQYKNSKDIEYYFFLYSDYVNNIQSEDEIIEQTVDTEEADPFDPELISIDTKKLTMETLLRRLKQNTINLNPDFQRNEVWTIEKKCQLIESLMLKIPLPMFYVSADEKNNYTVVDGLQRLSTIRDYIIEKKFRLQQLEFWGEHLEGFTFDDLPTHLENRVLETEFTFTVINQGTPDVVKRNIFKRVNRGGAPLTDQEIRHALYSGIATEFLKELSIEENFLKVTDYSIKSNRMLDREFILRLLAFVVRDYETYPKSGNMDAFLSSTLQIVNYKNSLNSKPPKGIDITNINITDINKLKDLFNKAINRAAVLFGEHAFRKSYSGKRRTPVNKALFEVWGTILSKISENEYEKLVKNKQVFLNTYIENYLRNYEFDEIISRNALKYSSVMERHKKLSQLVKQYAQ